MSTLNEKPFVMNSRSLLPDSAVPQSPKEHFNIFKLIVLNLQPQLVLGHCHCSQANDVGRQLLHEMLEICYNGYIAKWQLS